jgi:sterol desaturase/sphingolipid hydroxylase (fatty acid hydroxylase superfamily)
MGYEWLAYTYDVLGLSTSMFVRVMVILGIAFFIIKHSKKAKIQKVYKLLPFEGQLSFEIKTLSIICLMDGVVLTTANYVDAFPGAASTWIIAVLTFILYFFWAEMVYYFTHRLLHTDYLYWMHSHHHKSQVTTPFTAYSSSIFDRLLGMVLPIIPVIILFKYEMITVSENALIVYYVLLPLINIFTHINVEITPKSWSHNKWLTALLITPSYHALHHARYRGHYGVTTPLMDVIFGTTYKDYQKVHEKSRMGDGLLTLDEQAT